MPDSNIIEKAVPALSIAPGLSDRFEGSVDAGVQFTFAVTRSGDSTVAASVRYRVSSSQAVPGDFIGTDLQIATAFPTGILSFAPGETSKTIAIFVASDRVVESDEIFSVTLSEPVNATIGTASASGIIRDDDRGGVSGGEPTGQDLPASAATPLLLLPDSTFSAAIGFSSDHDWFRFEVATESFYLFEALGADDGAGSLADPSLSLRDSTGAEIAFNDDLGNGLSSRVSLFAAPGTYYLDVSGYQTSTGTYRLRALRDSTADIDPPGNPSTLRVLVPNELQIGRRQSPTDADWFAVDLTAGTAYEFGIIGQGLSDPLLRLRAGDGTVLVTNDDSADSLDSILEYRPTVSGRYFLDVDAYSESDVGGYSVYAQSTDALAIDTFSFTTGSLLQAEGNSGNRALPVTVTRSGPLSQAATVRVDLEHGNSSDADLDLSAGTDGGALSFLVSFGPGASTAVLNLLIRGDTTLEPDEQFYLFLSPAGGQATGIHSAVAVTLANDDQATGSNSVLPVYRFAKISNGAYFFTGSEPERGQILAGFPDFRPEGVGFYAYSDSALGAPVFRFANLTNGGYFYTGSVAERDATIANYPNMRYEGSTFSVATPTTPNAQPVYRLANLNNGAYLYTTAAAERDAAQSLGFWRSEGVSFFAPQLPGPSTPPPADDFAANTATGGRLLAGQTTTGAIEAAGDTDWFAITLDAGQRYTFDLRSAGGTPESTLGDPLLALWNASSQILLADDNSGGGAAARIAFTPSLSGTYYLDAQGNGGSRGAYALSASVSSTPQADDFSASSGTSGRAEAGRTASGQIEAGGDVDWLGVVLGAGRQYTFSVAAASGALRPAVEVIGPTGAVVGSNPNAGSAASVDVAVVPPTAGTYFVAIRGTTSSMAGGYTLGTLAGGIATGVTGSIGFTGDEKPIMGEGSALSPGSITLNLQRTGPTTAGASATIQLVFNEDANEQDIDQGASGFSNASAVVTFAPGQATQVLRIVARGDSSEEPSFEALHVRIVSASNATVGGRAQLRLQIQDDDRGGGAFLPPDGGLVFDPAGLETGQDDLSAIAQGTDGLWV